MLKRFKKLCEKEGLTKEVKRNSYYEKPSERKRRQMRKSVRQALRKQRLGSSPKSTKSTTK
jgi:small subunit ribosomal protein S21